MDKFIITLTFYLSAHNQLVNCGGISDFSYDLHSPHGPYYWVDKYPYCDDGRQSPIDIKVNKLKQGVYTSQLRLEGLETAKVKSVEVSNRALTVHCNFTQWRNNQPLRLHGGPLCLNCTYELGSMHYHWGIVDEDGSEHAINGKKFALEVHYVFHNREYLSAANATNFLDGFVVIAVLCDVKDDSSDKDLLNLVKYVEKEGDTITISGAAIDLKELFPSNFIYAHYKGSFTTPPCFQIVEWIVSMDTLSVNPTQIKALRRCHDSSLRPLSNNFRPLQLTNSRVVSSGLISTEKRSK